MLQKTLNLAKLNLRILDQGSQIALVSKRHGYLPRIGTLGKVGSRIPVELTLHKRNPYLRYLGIRSGWTKYLAAKVHGLEMFTASSKERKIIRFAGKYMRHLFNMLLAAGYICNLAKFESTRALSCTSNSLSEDWNAQFEPYLRSPKALSKLTSVKR